VIIQLLLTIGRRIRAALGDPLRRFQISVAALFLLILAGTGGYVLLEGMRPGEALYMTVITITTVGFGEVQPLSPVGRAFTIGLILVGIGAVTSAISNAVEVVLGQRLWTSVQKRRMEAWLMVMQDHYIVAGYGRIGRQIVRDLRARGQTFVVVESDPGLEEEFIEDQIPHVFGDATQEEALQRAGIERAYGFVATLNTDADNVLSVLTARELNERLFIVARATTAAFEKRLRRAGADRVVSPYDIGGHRIALALLRPAVHDLLNQVFDSAQTDADIGQIRVRPESPLAGQTLGQCDLRQVSGLTILAIQKPDGEFTINPNSQRRIEVGETVIVIGPPDAIYQLESAHGMDGAATS